MKFPKDIEYLVQKYLDGQLSDAEDQCLAAAIEQNEEIRHSLQQVLQLDDAISQNIDEYRSEEMFSKALAYRLQFKEENDVIKKPVRKITSSKIPIKIKQSKTNIWTAIIPIAACLVFGFLLLTNQQAKGVKFSSNSLEVVEETLQYNKGFRIQTGTEITNNDEQDLVLQYQDKTLVTIKPNSSVRVEKKDNKQLTLTKGSVHLIVSKQVQGKPFVLASKHADVEILGTEFSLELRENFAELAVDEGRVQFSRPNGSDEMIVSAGKIAKLGKNINSLTNIGEIQEAETLEPVNSFSIVNIKTEEAIPGFELLKEGQVISLQSIGTKDIGIRANHTQHIGAISFVAKNEDGEKIKDLQFKSPFIFELNEDNFIKTGVYTISARPRTKNGVEDEEKIITIRFVD